MKALPRRGMLPFSSTIPARLLTPISVPIVSNISINRKVITQIAISTDNMLLHSNFIRIGDMEGGVSRNPVKLVTPRGIPMMVVARIPINNAPTTFLTNKTEVSRMPKQARSTAGECRSPKVTSVASLALTIPAFFKPMNAMKSPMPGDIARRRISGMESTIFCLSPVMVRRMNMIPSRNTAVKANCHV